MEHCKNWLFPSMITQLCCIISSDPLGFGQSYFMLSSYPLPIYFCVKFLSQLKRRHYLIHLKQKFLPMKLYFWWTSFFSPTGHSVLSTTHGLPAAPMVRTLPKLSYSMFQICGMCNAQNAMVKKYNYFLHICVCFMNQNIGGENYSTTFGSSGCSSLVWKLRKDLLYCSHGSGKTVLILSKT
jgi:hypothetical protein